MIQILHWRVHAAVCSPLQTNLLQCFGCCLGVIYKKNKTSNPSSLVNEDFIFVAPSQISLGGVLFAKKKEKKKSSRHEKPTFFVQEFGYCLKKVGFFINHQNDPQKLHVQSLGCCKQFGDVFSPRAPAPRSEGYPPWKLRYPLKIDGWKM